MTRFFTTVLVGLVALTGCRDDGISVYDIPKHAPESRRPAPIAESPAGEGSPAPLTWTAPPDWVAQSASGMRVASMRVPGAGGSPADFSVVAFPGDAGGLLANVNRWRGQVGLAPLDAAGLDAALTRVKAAAGEIAVVDLTGAAGGKPVRLLGGIIEFGGRSWFFKLMGDRPVVESAKPAFMTLLGTVHAR